MRVAPSVTLRVTNDSPRRGLSWLNNTPSGTGIKAVSFTAVDGLPVTVDLAAGIRAAGMERSVDSLGRRCCRAKHLRARCSGKLHRLRSIQVLLGLEHEAKGLRPNDIGCIKRLVERHADMALGAKVVDLIGPNLLHRHRQARGIGEVRVVQVKPIADRWTMR